MQLPHLSRFSNTLLIHFDMWTSAHNQDKAIGWGIGYTPNRTVTLEHPLEISLHLTADQDCILTLPIPDMEGGLVSLATQTIHQITGLPLDHIHLNTSHDNPFPEWDSEAIRPFFVQCSAVE